MEFILWQSTIIAAVYLATFLVAPIARALIGHETPAGRNQALDAMRALAAVGVVACHINQYMSEFLGYANPVFGNHLGILGVQMFFALTAFLFTEKALSGRLETKAFYIGRMRRILPLYCAVVGVALAMAFYYSWHITIPARQMALEIVDVFSFGFWKTDTITFRDINMMSLIGITWTLSYEWAFYMLLVPGYYLYRESTMGRFAIMAAVSILLLRDFYIQNEQVIWPFFLPGIVAALLKDRMSAVFSKAFLLASLPAIALVFWLPGFWTPIKLALTTIIFFGVVFGAPRWLRWAPLQTLGTISYSIYLVQYLVLYPGIQTIYTSPAFASIEARLAMGVCIAVTTVLVAALAYRFIERPWMNVSKSPGTGDSGDFPTSATALKPVEAQLV
ncbi:acyltransferase family protein [Brucella sp. LJL56]